MLQWFLHYRISPPSFYLLPLEVHFSHLVSFSPLERVWDRLGEEDYTSCYTTSLHHLPYARGLLCIFTYQPSFISYLVVDKPTIWLEATAIALWNGSSSHRCSCCMMYPREYLLFFANWFISCSYLAKQALLRTSPTFLAMRCWLGSQRYIFSAN